MKTEKQLTAVEWLCNEWLYLDQQFDMCLIDRNIYWDKLRQIQEQAKEMEKEQQMKTYKVALMRGMSYDEDVYHENKWRDPEKYYNETFKQQ